MKNFSIIILFSCFVCSMHAQEAIRERKTVTVNSQAGFPGGDKALEKFIKQNLVIPNEALKAKNLGECTVKFTVNEDGSLSDAKLTKEIIGCGACTQEAINLVSKMPNWVPAKTLGKPVTSVYDLVVSFNTQ